MFDNCADLNYDTFFNIELFYFRFSLELESTCMIQFINIDFQILYMKYIYL